MSDVLPLLFTKAAMHDRLTTLTDPELDDLNFGVIGFDSKAVVRRYNRPTSQFTALSREHVLGRPLFTVVPCMNNFMVAQRFEDAAAEGTELDAIIPYALTFCMRSTTVKLRLLASHSRALRYVLVNQLD